MNSSMFKLNLQDLAKGAVSAVVAAIVLSVGSVVQQSGFDVFSTDWGAVLNTALSAALSGFIGYVGKNFLSDEQGKFLGKVG